MTKELRRLSIIILLMFLALFGATSWIQVVDADLLAANPANKRTLYDSYQVQRGSIIVGGAAIAYSTPSTDIYSSLKRTYVDPDMWAPVTGYINPVLQSSTGIERAMNSNSRVRAAPRSSSASSRSSRARSPADRPSC